MSANPDTAATTGRNKPAQGKERSAADQGHASQNTASPEGATQGAWPVVPLGELAADERNAITDGPFGSKLKTDHYTETGPRVIRLKNIGDAEFVDAKAHISEAHFGTLQKHRVFPGDVVIAALGEDPPRSCLVPEFLGPAIVKADCIRFKAGQRILPKFINYVLNAPDLRRHAKAIVHGVGRPRLNLGEIRGLPIPVPPLPEQRRIVAEIEKQFTRLESGVAALRRVQANLKRFRAAVLKAACEGRLVPTEDELRRTADDADGTDKKLRESASSAKSVVNSSGYETGNALLARILTERRQNWQGRGKYKEPAAPDTTNLSMLPETWTWVSWEMVLAHEDGAFKRGPFGSALTKAIFVEKGFKVYEQYCPINDDCSFARYYITPEKFEELQAFEVKAGDYLISCSGSLGRITRVPEQFDRGIINQALLRVRISDSVINHRYFLHLFRSALFQKALLDNSTGSAIPNVKGVKELKAMAIPLPPLAEQTRIVAEVERRLSVVEELESVVTVNLQRATRLRQSILQKAFTVEL